MLTKIINFIIRYSIYLTALLIPILWLPYTFEGYEYNKLYLLFFLSIIGFSAWLLKMFVIEKRFTVKRTPFDIFILIILIANILSAIFSKDTISSWFGYYGRYTDSVIGLLCMIAMYYLITNNISKEASKGVTVKGLFQTIITSIAFTVLAAIMSVFGLWQWGSQLSGSMSLKSFNLTASSAEGLAVYLSAMFAMLTGLILVNYISDKKAKDSGAGEKINISLLNILKIGKKLLMFNNVLLFILFLVVLYLLIKINFWAAWVVVGLSMIILIVFAFWTKLFSEKINMLLLPIIIVVLSGTALFFNINKFLGMTELPNEIILEQSTAQSVTWESFKDNPVLGTGPGNFSYSFNKYKPESYNQNKFWNIRFDKAPSYVLEIISTGGAVGFLAYIALIIAVYVILFKNLFKIRKASKLTDKNDKYLLLSLPLCLAAMSIIISQFVYLNNYPLMFALWFCLALCLGIWRQSGLIAEKEVNYSFARSPELGLVLTTVLLIIIIVFAGFGYVAGKYYLADIKHKQGLILNDLERQIAIFENAVDLDNNKYPYRINLSRVYLSRAWQEANKSEAERNIDLLKNLAAASLNQAQAATALNPNNVSVWENNGIINRDLRSLVSGSYEKSINSFEKAIQLEPINPLYQREICRLKLTAGLEEDWSETINYCQKAIDLKPNYLDAYVQLALVYEKSNDIDKSIQNLQAALAKAKGVGFEPNSAVAKLITEIYFHLGRLYFNKSEYDQALTAFSQAITLESQHSNARFGIASVYEAKGQYEQALEQYKIVGESNSNNESVKQKIQLMEAKINPQKINTEEEESEDTENVEDTEE